MKELAQGSWINGLHYKLVGDYYIPALMLPGESIPIGRWGQLRRIYLKQHRPVLYCASILNGALWQDLADSERQACSQLKLLIEQMKQLENVTDALMIQDRGEWTKRMNSIGRRAEKIICCQVICR